jgi:hypothetical protein
MAAHLHAGPDGEDRQCLDRSRQPAHGFLEDGCGPGAGEMQLGEIARALCNLDLLADEVPVEVPDHFLGQPGADVQPEGVAIRVARQAVDEHRGDDTGLDGGEERLAATVEGEVADIVRAEIVEEDGGFRSD